MTLLQGADPNVPNNSGRTPAYRVVSKSGDVAYPIMLDLFRLAHADVNARDEEGNTALALARQHGHESIVRILQAHGAGE